MSQKYLLVAALTMLITAQACTGYHELKNEIKAYRPPTYMPAKARTGADHTRRQIDTDFLAEKKQLAKAKARWENALTSVDEVVHFYRPDPKILESIRSSDDNDSTAAHAIKTGFSRETLEALTLLRNPGIKAAKSRFQGAIETFSQVSNLDEILRQYTAFSEALKPGIGPMRGRDPVQMKFPFPGVLSLKGAIAGQETRAAWEGLEIARRDAVTTARKAYWNLIFNHRALKITEDTLELFKHLESVANSRYEGGETSFLDVIKARIEREILEEELITLQENQRNINSKIREIVNLSPESLVGSPNRSRPRADGPPLASLYPLAIERRQELRQMRAKVGKMQRMIEMAETMIMPPYTLNLSLYSDEAVNQVGSKAMKETFPVATTAAIGAGLPKMPWHGSNDAFLRETRKKLQALKEDLIKSEAETATMVRNSWFNLDRAKREAALYSQTVVKLSQAALDVSAREYETGKIAFADVISSYTTWLRANLTLERKKSDLGIARAELERVVGTSLN